MANKKHLNIIKRGVKEWNQWRDKFSSEPDLTNADLSGMDLQDIDFSETDLRKAILVNTIFQGAGFARAILAGANLNKANLNSASLITTNLIGATLREAVLTNADFYGADLQMADLTDSDLIFANLSYADLRGAIMESAILGSTIFGGCNMSGVKGLDSCQHSQSSIIDHETLTNSGRLPIQFLRGCGLSDKLIDYLPSLAAEAIEFYSCFISYSTKDQTFAERLYSDLQNKGVRCWYAPENLKIGERVRIGIDESIRVHDRLLLVLSKNSIRSNWVEKEVETALEQESIQKRVILFPIRLDDSVMKIEIGWPADIRRTRNIGNFRTWKSYDQYQKAFDRLLRDLRTEGLNESRA